MENSEEAKATKNMSVQDDETHDDADVTVAVTSNTFEEKEQVMNNADQGDLSEDGNFGDFATATPSNVTDDAQGEQTGDRHVSESDNVVSEAVLDEQAETLSAGNDFEGFEVPPENVSHLVEGGEKEQLPPPGAFDDPFANLSTDSHVGQAMEAVPSVPANEHCGNLESSPGDDNVHTMGGEEQEASPSDPLAHLSTGFDDERAPNVTAEAVNAAVSDNEQDSSPEGDLEYFSTYSPKVSCESASENNGVESETSQDSSPDNDAGYFSAVTDGDDNEESNVADEQTEKQSLSPENMVHLNFSNENPVESKVDDLTHGVTNSDAKTTDKKTAAKRPSIESSSSENIKKTSEVEDDLNDTAADPVIDESDGFAGVFEQANVAVSQAEENEDAEDGARGRGDNISTDAFQKIEESGLPGSGVVGEVGETDERMNAEGATNDVGDDDDFGDFGSFEQAAQAPVDDSHRPGTASPESEPADDDFGDFASFAEPTGAPQEVVHSEQEEDDDDFGDFTDFASGAADQENSTSVITAVESSSSNVVPTETPATSVSDSIVNKAEIIFREVFALDSISDEDNESGSERIVVRVDAILNEIATSSVNEDPSAWLMDSLASVMRGIEHLDKSGPTAIVNESSKYPFAHFAVPICGLPMTNVDIRGRTSRRSQSKKEQDSIAFTESRDDSVGASFSADTMDGTDHPPFAQQSTGTVVSLPPSKSNSNTITENGADPADHSFADFQSSHGATEPSRVSQATSTGRNGKKETLSSSAKQFLQQIPDLSFMLKPTLSLPKKS